MEQFFRVSAGVLLTLIVGIMLSKQSKDMMLVLSIAVCCMVVGAVVGYIKPVLDFLSQLKSLANLESDMVQILLKVMGISLLGEICVLFCNDSGNTALGKGVQMLETAAILWLSMPLMEALITLVQKILGGI